MSGRHGCGLVRQQRLPQIRQRGNDCGIFGAGRQGRFDQCCRCSGQGEAGPGHDRICRETADRERERTSRAPSPVDRCSAVSIRTRKMRCVCSPSFAKRFAFSVMAFRFVLSATHGGRSPRRRSSSGVLEEFLAGARRGKRRRRSPEARPPSAGSAPWRRVPVRDGARLAFPATARGRRFTAPRSRRWPGVRRTARGSGTEKVVADLEGFDQRIDFFHGVVEAE